VTAVGTIPTSETLPEQTGGLHKSVSQFAKELAQILLINVEKYEQQIMKLDMKKQ